MSIRRRSPEAQAAAEAALSVVGDILGRAHDWDVLTVRSNGRPGSWTVVVDTGGWVASVVVDATVTDIVLKGDGFHD